MGTDREHCLEYGRLKAAEKLRAIAVLVESGELDHLTLIMEKKDGPEGNYALRMVLLQPGVEETLSTA